MRTLLSKIRECHDQQGVLMRTPQEVLRPSVVFLLRPHVDRDILKIRRGVQMGAFLLRPPGVFLLRPPVDRDILEFWRGVF